MASLSDRLSVISTLAGGAVASVTSTELSAASAQAASADAVMSEQISVLSQAVSVISAGLGAPQKRSNTNAQVISATAFTKISGLSLSIAANAGYRVEGQVLFTTSILTGTAFGFVYPGNNQVSTGSMRMECVQSVIVAQINLTSANYSLGRIGQAQMSTAATTNISLLGGASGGVTHELDILGYVNVTSAGVIELMAKQSATGGGVQILPGSYLRAYKIT